MISVIIVGYNSKKHLRDCLESLFASKYKKFEVIFVDNNSQDGSINYIEKEYPRVKLIQGKKNLGFAGGNNLGIDTAVKNKSEYVFLLNPDTIIDPDCLGQLVEKADRNTILQPLILLHDGKRKTDLVNSAGNVLNFLGFSYCGDYKKNKSEIASDKDISVASGAAMLIPAEIIRKIGMFDESFFMYHEDVDLSWRARIAGYNIRLIKDAIVWHKYSFSKNKNKFFYAERNRLIFLFKNSQTKTLLLILPLLLLNEIFLLLYATIDGWFIAKIQSSVSFVQGLSSVLRARKKMKRAKTDKDLKKHLSSKLSFSELDSPALRCYNILVDSYWKIILKFV
ncbi:MAG: glycosyltransferase family 2 protein [Patescibacteria group bacterium]|jgi:hypothetical protein